MSQVLRYPRPPTLARLGAGHCVVESSAGTGKTFLLEHLFVDLILTRGLSCEQILVVTFTEKATAELVLRLRKLIARLADLRAAPPRQISTSAAYSPASRSVGREPRNPLIPARGFRRLRPCRLFRR